MTVRQDIDRNARAVARGQSRGPAAQVTQTDLASDLSKLSDELLKKVCPTAVGYAGTIVRKEARSIIANGGTRTVLGKSYKTTTRGVPDAGFMKNVGRGSWSEKILRKRGANNKSIADAGGIIKRNISRKAGGLVSSQIVGPKYDTGQAGKNFAHTHEPKNGEASGTKNHHWWGQPAGYQLPPRPFMKPASENTMVEQKAAIVKALKRWDVSLSEY